MKNSAKFVLTLALTVASAASCHKEIAVQGEGSAELTLNPQVDVLTKAPIAGATFPNERTIVLSAAYHNGSGSSANYFQGITFSKNATLGSWVGGGGSNPKYWPVSGSLDLLAYSADGFTNAPTPDYATKCSESVTLTVPSENNTKQVDILFAGATDRSASGSALSMQFKHAEAVVAFDAKAQVPYDATKNLGVTINQITLKGVKTYGTVTLNINGTCSWSGGTAGDVNLPGIPSGYNVPANYIHNTATKPFAIGNTGLIVIPQTATSFTVNYTVHYGKNSAGGAVDKDETFTHDIPDSPKWEPGKKYVYNLEFKLDEILVATEILDWTPSIGSVPVPPKISATYKDSDLTKTEIDLCAPDIPAKLSAGAIVGFDWGDGCREIIENTTDSEMARESILHKYSAVPTDSVKIYVRKGTLDFGTVETEYFNLYNVYKNTEVLVKKLTDLSKTGTANCYIVSEAGKYKFKATVKGNSTNPADVIAPTKVEVLWESATSISVGDLIEVGSVKLNGDYVSFKAMDKKGNAVIAVKDGDGKILWSWHIWLTDKPEDQVYKNDAGTMMDRNLGATSATRSGGVNTYGLLYQWGRKDPFLGYGAASTISWTGISTKGNINNVSYSIENPTTFIDNATDSPFDWTTRDDNLWKSSKTMYDPCPPGYRVPDGGDGGVWNKAGFANTNFDSTNRGMSFSTLQDGGTTWYPAAGYRMSNVTLFQQRERGYYWSCTPNGNCSYRLFFNESGTVNPTSGTSKDRSNGESVRCLLIK